MQLNAVSHHDHFKHSSAQNKVRCHLNKIQRHKDFRLKELTFVSCCFLAWQNGSHRQMYVAPTKSNTLCFFLLSPAWDLIKVKRVAWHHCTASCPTPAIIKANEEKQRQNSSLCSDVTVASFISHHWYLAIQTVQDDDLCYNV